MTRVAAFVSSPLSSRSDSSSPTTRSSSTPRRSRTVVSTPSPVRVAPLQAPRWSCRPPRAAYGVLRFVMESGAKGCEVVISGKLRAARAKSMKLHDGFMIHSGQPVKDFVDEAVRHVL